MLRTEGNGKKAPGETELQEWGADSFQKEKSRGEWSPQDSCETHKPSLPPKSKARVSHF